MKFSHGIPLQPMGESVRTRNRYPMMYVHYLLMNPYSLSMNHHLITISQLHHHLLTISALYIPIPITIFPPTQGAQGRPISSRTKAQGVKRFPVTCDSTVALLAKLAASAASTQPGATEPATRKRGVHQQNFLWNRWAQGAVGMELLQPTWYR